MALLKKAHAKAQRRQEYTREIYDMQRNLRLFSVNSRINTNYLVNCLIMLQRNGTLNKVVQIAFFIFLVMALGACALPQGREDERPTITRFGNAEQLFENGTLVCSQECTDRGFCGVTDSGERVILANTQDPSTQRYNWFFVENSPVTITDFQQRIARYQVSQQNEAVFYYKVANANFEEAWVAGWCVGK